jgi:spore maturation protein CgeB
MLSSRMKLVIFGLSVSSSWGNGHATIWRGLVRALGARGHKVIFFERDVPYYAEHRDLRELPGGELVLYSTWTEIEQRGRRELSDADAGIITSYCPDGPEASALVLASPARVKCFYDLDTPITLQRVKQGETASYLPPGGLAGFDVVLSFTGGTALTELRTLLGARHVAALYGSVDPDLHRPLPAAERYRADVSYLGTFAEDRQAALEMLFLEPARRLPHRKFLIGGSLYPPEFAWPRNVLFAKHVPAPEHAVFYCSSRLTVNVTRAAMAESGYCPSGRLFEAAACGVPILSDDWPGLDHFFEPGLEILVARTTGHAMDALEMNDEQLRRIARAARERTLESHTAAVRVLELENILEAARKAPAEPRAFGREG